MNNKHYMSVKDLRVYLDEREAIWTPEDDQYLGKFEDQSVMVDCFKNEGEHKFSYKGIGHARISYDGTLGFIIEPTNIEKLWVRDKVHDETN